MSEARFSVALDSSWHAICGCRRGMLAWLVDDALSVNECVACGSTYTLGQYWALSRAMPGGDE